MFEASLANKFSLRWKIKSFFRSFPGLENSLAARVRSLLRSSLYLDHSHCLVLAPATLAALPSTRAIETRSLPTSLAATHRGFAFYVASPKSSIPWIATCSISEIPFVGLKLAHCPRSLAPTLVTLPSISLIPCARFSNSHARGNQMSAIARIVVA